MFVPRMNAQRGVVVVIGEMGNGKSTILNSLINMLNEKAQRPEHEDEDLFVAASE